MKTTFVRRAARPLGAALALTLLIAALAPRITPAAAARPAVPIQAMAAPFDLQFIDMMAPHHQSAVVMARVALARARHPQIKRLAQAIVADQAKEIAQMKAWRKAWYGSDKTPTTMPMLPGLPMGMMHDSMGDVNSLKKANPFDRAFLDDMMPHHELAVAAAKLELARGSHAQLKALALSIVEGQSREVGLMQAYRELWYGSGMGTMGGM